MARLLARPAALVGLMLGVFAVCFSGPVHYAWVVLVVMFCAMLAAVGVRAAPGVMILPLVRAFARWLFESVKPVSVG